jgi:hypothetical protein
MARTTTSQARKQETREKIELGGLIVKAGLRREKRAVLLGALIELAVRLAADEKERGRLAVLGEKVFTYDHK